MGDQYMKKTQSTLGKIIKKPPLTDKLLGKPPFRFLHDITTEVIRTTGFLNGLFTPEEMDSKNVSVKEDKMKFLQKIIDVVSIVLGKQMAARPSKIVAGHEPEKTNELLQGIAKCITKNLSSDDAVSQVLSGKESSRAQEKPPSGSSRKKDSKERMAESKRSKRDATEDRSERERSSDRRKSSHTREAREKNNEKEEDPGEHNEEAERHGHREKSRDKDKNREERRERKKREEERRRVEQEADDQGGSDLRSPEDDEKDKKDEDQVLEKPSGSRPPRPSSAKGHRRPPASDRSRPHDPRESSSKGRPARPPSARPAAPRVRQRPGPAEEEIARMESAGKHRTAPIIVDRGGHQDGGGMSSSDEDEQFLVQEENDVDLPEMEKLSPVQDPDNKEMEDEEHGGLVRKILETKKELEHSASKGANVSGKKRTEIERSPVNEAQRRKERELVMRNIEKLRGSVQKLCRSAVPLGKIIDYIQEDMDSMQNELLQWRKENKEHAAKLKEEESITIKTIEPLQAELQELDRNIAAQMDMIAASKCNVIKNQEKIDKMIAGVTART